MRPLLLKAHVKEYGTWIIKQWQAACVVVVILRHRYHHSEGDLSQSSRGGKNPDNNKILGPAHTQKNWLLFPSPVLSLSRKKMLLSHNILYPVAVPLDKLGLGTDSSHHSKLRSWSLDWRFPLNLHPHWLVLQCNNNTKRFGGAAVIQHALWNTALSPAL